MAEEKILTQHPQGKTGRNINKNTYDLFKREIISTLEGKKLTHNELFEYLDKRLKNEFSGNIGWYGETVKLDLEARKIVGRTDDKPQKYFVKKPHN